MEYEHIIMKCKDENTNYPDPPEMFNKNGTCKFAYVTLVMLGDAYVSGAIIVANSARKAGSLADLVVLVTPDVSENGKEVLGKFFTHVIEVDFITVPNWRVQKQPHRKYLELVFTKLHLFNLTQYEKVLFIDADAIILKHPDHLFTLNAPAGSLIEYKDQLITYDKNGNYVYPRDGELKWYKEMCDCCEHGKKIDKKITDKVFSDFKNSGVAAGLWLLEPKEGELDRILKDVSQGRSKWLVGQKYVWPEQQYLTGFYSGRWTSINPRFYGLQGYPHWSVLYSMQYAGDKPFVEQSKAPITERMKYADFVLWHQFYYEILKAHPDLQEAPSLKEANSMNRFFQTSIKEQNKIIKRTELHLSKNLVDYTPKAQVDKKILEKLYNVEENIINDTQLKYYHSEIDSDYNNLQLRPMWDDIKHCDYLEPTKRLAKYFGKKSYYQELVDKYQDNFDIKDDPIKDIDSNDKDLVMLEYLKCKKDVFVLTFWPIVLQQLEAEEIKNIVSKYGNIVYSKQLTLGKKALYNLMYSMYDDITYKVRYDAVEKKMNYVQSGETNQILTIFLENTENLNISGHGAIIKTKIRKELGEILKLSENKFSHLVHINDFFYQTVAYSQILLNENTLKMLEYQNSQNITDNLFRSSRLKIQTLKKWCFQNLSQLEMERLILIDDSVLFSYGIKKINNINGIFSKIENETKSQSEEELLELVNSNFNLIETKFFFSNIQIENYLKSNYKINRQNTESNDILNYFDIDSHIEMLTDPKNYYYFSGIKFCLPKYTIYKKIQQNKYKDHADFLILATLYPALISEFVRVNNGKIIYDDKLKSNEIKEPVLDNQYLKKLLHIIYKKYSKNDINKFKQTIQLI